jgi:predicted DNA-binding transcriptional regulator AlpA
MTVLLRFRDLKARGIVKTRPTLKRRVKKDGFPPGRMTGPNERTWTEEEVDAWYRTRPVEGPALRGAAKRNRERARKAADSTAASSATA